MRRILAVLSTLGLPADRARWSADHNFGRNCWKFREEQGDLPHRHMP